MATTHVVYVFIYVEIPCHKGEHTSNQESYIIQANRPRPKVNGLTANATTSKRVEHNKTFARPFGNQTKSPPSGQREEKWVPETLHNSHFIWVSSEPSPKRFMIAHVQLASTEFDGEL